MNVISQLQTQRWYIMLRLYQMNLTETESVPGYRILWLQYNIYCLRKQALKCLPRTTCCIICTYFSGQCICILQRLFTNDWGCWQHCMIAGNWVAAISHALQTWVSRTLARTVAAEAFICVTQHTHFSVHSPSQQNPATACREMDTASVVVA